MDIESAVSEEPIFSSGPLIPFLPLVDSLSSSSPPFPLVDRARYIWYQRSGDLETAYPRPRYTTKQALKTAAMEEQLAVLIKSVNNGRAASEARFDTIQMSLELWRPD